MTVKAAITNGSPSRNRRSRRKTCGALRAMPDHVNSPDRKKNIAMKKLSVAEHDDVEADPGRRVGVTEIGVGNDRVVQQHHQREEGAGPIERQIARLGLRRGVRLCADRRGM